MDKLQFNALYRGVEGYASYLLRLDDALRQGNAAVILDGLKTNIVNLASSGQPGNPEIAGHLAEFERDLTTVINHQGDSYFRKRLALVEADRSKLEEYGTEEDLSKRLHSLISDALVTRAVGTSSDAGNPHLVGVEIGKAYPCEEGSEGQYEGLPLREALETYEHGAFSVFYSLVLSRDGLKALEKAGNHWSMRNLFCDLILLDEHL
ncbi:hypothetical protein KY360_03055 [Candidatus Woesearchaeota archaeon]|nr:hypothetical protein [Candidatus Woesearchaeota archaeon]